jgi:molybdopterin/thiamine biosynthesis adenylyltransferase
MKSINAAEYSRNYGFWTEEEQSAVINAKIAIAGVGGDGFQLGLKLAMMGVQTLDIADPEVFEPENTNRVPGAVKAAYGRKKVDVFAERVHEINPDADVRIFENGVTKDNVKDFLRRATLVFDESELTHPHIGTMVAREARRRGIPVVLVMNVGFAAQVTSFDPKSKWTFERFMGWPDDMPLEDVKKQLVDYSRCLPYIPHYADLTTLKAVRGGAPLPSISTGVDVASALGSCQAFLYMTKNLKNNRQKPIIAPAIAYADAYSFKSGITRLPRVSHYFHLNIAAVNNILGRNSMAAYREHERLARRRAR